MEIIDFHTHTFEDYVATRAIDKLSRSANIINYTSGTDSELSRANKNDGVSLSIVLPVATRIMQGGDINARNYRKNMSVDESGVLFFAAIHPEDSRIHAKLSDIKVAGFKGIKLHPVFQDAYIDEKCYLDIIDAASELDLITVIHAGEDISYPGNTWAGVRYIINMLDTLHPRNVVLAHMGGWNEWDVVESDLAGADVYFDTSFCLTDIVSKDETKGKCNVKLSPEQFGRIVELHGSDKILFGTDSPWASRQDTVEAIMNMGFDSDVNSKIFAGNAKTLLKL